MTTIKKSDFIEVEYTGMLKDGAVVFDTTDEKLAKEKGVHNPSMEYGPIVICLGQNNILKAIDDFLEGKELKKEYTLELEAEKAFGKKDPKLLKIVPTSEFRKQNINPVPGLQLNLDGIFGIIRTVTGGRTIVDFNHPLAGRDVIYKLKVNKIVTDIKEKVKTFLRFEMGTQKIDFDVKDNIVEIKVKKEVPKEVKEALSKKISEVVTEIKKVEFTPIK
ncbi:peptidylprolyl isomerase [Candidatus Woesearchaeota archaeon]|nr:peptidylprolyl isomerase [Candidatus Woesearchaeota archaeon]